MSLNRMQNIDAFLKVVEQYFQENQTYFRDQYQLHIACVPGVLAKLEVALAATTPFNLNCQAIKAACSTLNIEHSYSGINQFLAK